MIKLVKSGRTLTEAKAILRATAMGLDPETNKFPEKMYELIQENAQYMDKTRAVASGDNDKHTPSKNTINTTTTTASPDATPQSATPKKSTIV